MNQIQKNTIRAFKTVLIILIYIQLQACDMEGPRIEVHIINLSKDTVYVDDMEDTGDTSEAKRDVRKYCSGDNRGVFYSKLNPDDSTIVAVKTGYGPIKILVINVDSLKDCCSKGDTNVTNKKWLKIMVNDKINENTKLCTFTIN